MAENNVEDRVEELVKSIRHYDSAVAMDLQYYCFRLIEELRMVRKRLPPRRSESQIYNDVMERY